MKNEFEIEGVVFEKTTTERPNKKDAEHPYQFHFIKLEVTARPWGKEIASTPEFRVTEQYLYDQFDKGDRVVVRFMITGKQISPTWHKTELVAAYIRFADITTDKSKEGTIYAKDIKVEVPDMESVFNNNDEGLGDLPF